MPAGGITGIVRGGELLNVEAHGLADIVAGIQITTETQFHLASVTKQFTAALVLMLVAEGKVSLTDAPARYLPAMPDLGITIDHLLACTTGLPEFHDFFWLGGGWDAGDEPTPPDVDAMIARCRHLNFDPGSRFLYGNTGYWLLGRMIEKIEGRALGEVLHRRIFAPLGMSRTEAVPILGDQRPGLARGYLAQPDGSYRRAPNRFPLGGEGCIVSTVPDLAAWARHLDTADPLLEAPYGRGLRHGSRRGMPAMGHEGVWPGWRAEFWRIPSIGVTEITLRNCSPAQPPEAATASAPIPSDLAGIYVSADARVTWTIAADGTVRMAGSWRPNGVLHRARLVEADVLEIDDRTGWRNRTCTARVQRDAAGAVTGLLVSTPRTINLPFVRNG